MKRKVTVGIAISLVMFLVLGSISFRAMAVCVHGDDNHEQQAVHFHFGQLPGQNCGESRAGLCHASREGMPRHFSLGLETIINPQISFKRLLSQLPPAQFHDLNTIFHSPVDLQGAYRFHNPSNIFTDTAFMRSTILII